MFHRGQHAAAAGWFALVAACVFWKVIFLQHTLYWGDILLYFLPMITFAHRWLTQGVIPLWNPHLLWGQPFMGNPQEWLFYPSTLLLCGTSPGHYLAWNAVLHLWLGGMGMWLFVRNLGVGHAAALFAGTAWMLCGAFVPRAQFPGMFQSIALLGWLFWATDRLLQNPCWGRAALLSCVIALVILAGHTQVTYMALLIVGCWIAWRVGKHPRRYLVPLSFSVTGAILLSAVHWLPMVQLLQETQRTSLSLFAVNRFPLHPEQVPLLLVPELYGIPWQGNWLGRGNYWEVACTVGILPLMAALAAWRAHPESRFWWIVAGVSLWLALGRTGGLYILAYYLLPGLKAFHDPARWLIITDFALCVLAALGWNSLRFHQGWLIVPVIVLGITLVWVVRGEQIIHWAAQQDTIRRSRGENVPHHLLSSAQDTATWGSIQTVLVTIAGVAVLRLDPTRRFTAAMALLLAEMLPSALHANPTTTADALSQPPPSVMTVARTGGRLFVPDPLPMWREYVSYTDYGSSSPQRLLQWQAMLGSNIGMRWAVSEASGYEPVAVRRAVEEYRRLSRLWQEVPCEPEVTEQLRYFGIGAVAFGANAARWRVFALPSPPVRAFHLPSGEPLPVSDLSPQQVAIARAPSGDILLTDTAYPGWRVEVNEHPQRWRVGNKLFRVVRVSQDGSYLLWKYQPDTFRVGLYLSLLGVAVVTAVLVGEYSGRKTQNGVEKVYTTSQQR